MHWKKMQSCFSYVLPKPTTVASNGCIGLADSVAWTNWISATCTVHDTWKWTVPQSRVSLEANFARNASRGASRVSLWNQIPSTKLKNVPHEKFAKQKCLFRGFRGTHARYSRFLSSFTCRVLYQYSGLVWNVQLLFYITLTCSLLDLHRIPLRFTELCQKKVLGMTKSQNALWIVCSL